jgi:hypothetical protein
MTDTPEGQGYSRKITLILLNEKRYNTICI